jgi:hypothetical protein
MLFPCVEVGPVLYAILDGDAVHCVAPAFDEDV